MITLPNRDELAKLFPKDGIWAELGTFKGDYAAVLFANTQPILLHLVDNFSMKLWDIEPADAKAEVLRRFAEELAAGSVELHCEDTIAWLAAQSPSSLDGVYGDSTHSKAHVYGELCQSFRVVRDGGWLAGHDYSAACNPGVVSAVDQFCHEHGQEITYVTDEPEFDLVYRKPWQPHRAAWNSYAIKVSK